MNTFKHGDKVRMKDGDRYCHGEVTIVGTNDGMIRDLPDKEIICKVIFQEDWAPDYWYYPAKDLELVSSERSERE